MRSLMDKYGSPIKLKGATVISDEYPRVSIEIRSLISQKLVIIFRDRILLSGDIESNPGPPRR